LSRFARAEERIFFAGDAGRDVAGIICDESDMNKRWIGLAGFGVVLGVGAIFIQERNLSELREEVGALRGDLARIEKLRQPAAGAANAPGGNIAAESARAEEERAELEKLRNEVKALSALAHAAVQQTQNATRLAQAATQAARGESPIPVKLTPAGDLKNAGRATLSAAVETVLSAAIGGDVDTLAGSILLDPAAQARADELFARLPEATRAQYGSPDKLIALMIAKDAASVTGMQVLGQRDISPDVIGVRLRLASEDGKTKEQGLAFQKTSDGLRAIIPADAVDKYAKQLSGK
jgi:hypothetical protein